MLTGQVQIMFADATLAVPNIQAGKVAALGTSSATQTGLVATVPPVAAVAPGFDRRAWQGIVAPAGTPPSIVGRLAAEMQKIQAAPEFRQQLVRFGMEPVPPGTPAEFASIIRAEQRAGQRPSRIPAPRSTEPAGPPAATDCRSPRHP